MLTFFRAALIQEGQSPLLRFSMSLYSGTTVDDAYEKPGGTFGFS